MKRALSWIVGFLLLSLTPQLVQAQYSDWKHSGSMWILTDKEGADLPAEAVVEQFPLLVKLYSDWFDFKQAQPRGEDIRFATQDGTPLAFEIDEWDAAKGEAAIWVRVPKIVGNTRQELRVFWGKSDAKSESNGAAVFNESNGYVAVWHMNERVADATGTYPSTDTGTTEAPGMIGRARHFPGGKGIFCGDKIETLPSGSSSHSTEAWFRIERPNTTLIGWGNEGGGRGSKVRMMYRGPHHIRIDSDFADVRTRYSSPYLKYAIEFPHWIHVAHTYDREDGRLYLNGNLDGTGSPLLNIKSPARLWLGGWYHNYDYVGDLDEVRISRVARSPQWLKLQFANQGHNPILVGPIVQSGDEFEVVANAVEVDEGEVAKFTARAGGAQQVMWGHKHPKTGRLVYDVWGRMRFDYEPFNFDEPQKRQFYFRAVYARESKTQAFTLKVRDTLPTPITEVVAPESWDGQQPLKLEAVLKNRDLLKKHGLDNVNFKWRFDFEFPISKTVSGATVVLKNPQGSGKLIVGVDDGSNDAGVEIDVKLPMPFKETWQLRTPDPIEQPEDGQFIARDDKAEGTLHYTGTLNDPAEFVFVRLFADDSFNRKPQASASADGSNNEKLIKTETRKVGADKNYSIPVTLKAGLIKYRTEFGTKNGDKETILHRASNLVCGDVFLLNGQSNTVATDFGKENPLQPSDWVRTFGATAGDPNGSRLKLWANAQARSPGGKSEIGYWGMELGRRLVESQKMPVCLINGAVGGTRIDQHQRNVDTPTDPSTIYGRLLWRAQQAKLTHGVRAILWHQGENDQGADGPSGDFGYRTYRELFFNLAASWKEDFPNVQRYYVFQIWPKACSMGVEGSDNTLREVQRTLPEYFSNLSVMSTLGIKPPGGCHFPAEGYAEFARLIAPVMEQQLYGRSFDKPVLPPNLKRAFFSNKTRDEVMLEFDQPVVWDEKLVNEFVFESPRSNSDGPKPERSKVLSGTANGSLLVLKLSRPAKAQVSYIDSAHWSPDRLLYGANGLAALSFSDVVIESE